MSWFSDLFPSPWDRSRGNMDARIAFEEGRKVGVAGGPVPQEVEERRGDLANVIERSWFNGYESGVRIARRRGY